MDSNKEHINSNVLYIIGNGFDLYHGLDTRYQTFGYFLQKYFTETYDLLVNNIGLPHLEINNDNTDSIWADFENQLANLDTEFILDNNTGLLPDISSDDFRDSDRYDFRNEMELIVEKITSKLFEAFNHFIQRVKYPYSIDNVKLNIDKSALFLNFNYTNTLEKYYEIKPNQILYIHNKASKDAEIILGHGVDPDQFNQEKDKPVPPEGLSEEDLDLWTEEQADNYDYSYELAKDEIMSYFEQSFKPTDDIIKQNEKFFSTLSSIATIYVLGHSMLEVDLPYFSEIIRSVEVQSTNWVISYYHDEEKEHHLKTLLNIGLSKEQIKLIKISDLMFMKITQEKSK